MLKWTYGSWVCINLAVMGAMVQGHIQVMANVLSLLLEVLLYMGPRGQTLLYMYIAWNQTFNTLFLLLLFTIWAIIHY